MRSTVFTFVILLPITSAAETAVIFGLYSYDMPTKLASGAAIGLLLVVPWIVWRLYKRYEREGNKTELAQQSRAGAMLGLLWLVEIAINNFLAPPLPGRDIIDNIFWVLIASGLFAISTCAASNNQSIRAGFRAGAWSGFVSGLIACWGALSLIIFAMPFILKDPLNIAEWSAQSSNTLASMAGYFAYQTFAGAFLHLLVLGLVMGGLLGFSGGIVGYSAWHFKNSARNASNPK